ncbi:MAG: SGNH/GDSL hydrolase family protein [Chloroflexota bacterium]|nr:SGNH/GDSL hydrolase family protein [Chloroflexota bacterium]
MHVLTLRRGAGLLGLGVLLALIALPPGAAAAPPARPVYGLGRIDAVMKDRLGRVWQAGQQLGQRANVLAKVGDSITASGLFLSDAGDGNAVLGAHPELASIIAYYRKVRVETVGGVAHNSLNRRSLAARAGYTAFQLYGPTVSPLQMEYSAINPAVAVIMIGSNDIDEMEAAEFQPDLAGVVDSTLQAGIIPILSTIPDRSDSPRTIARMAAFNAVIREEAAAEHLPLVDYWAALQPLANRGIGADSLHPTVYPAPRGAQGSVTFTERGLQYGWDLRNYLTLQMLARVRAVVFADGPPDE